MESGIKDELDELKALKGRYLKTMGEAHRSNDGHHRSEDG